MKDSVNDVIVYRCNPDKNIECNKTLCQTECFYTANKDYALDGYKGCTLRELANQE